MEPKFQSSFIPKGPLATTGSVTKTSRQSDTSFLGTLAVFVFVLSILATGGAFGYELYLKKDIGSLANQLLAAKSTLEPEIIKKISDLDERINATESLLNQHIILSPLFAYFEVFTVKNVRFTEFKYTSEGDTLKLSMRGKARGYSTLAYQAKLFNDSQFMRDVVFGDLSLDELGNVDFTFKATLDPAIIAFKSGDDTETDGASVEAGVPTGSSAGAAETGVGVQDPVTTNGTAQ